MSLKFLRNYGGVKRNLSIVRNELPKFSASLGLKRDLNQMNNLEKFIIPDKNSSYSMCEGNGLKLVSHTIKDRLDILAEQMPNSKAYKFCLSQTVLTFAELQQRVDNIAQNLLDRGFKKGDRLALFLPNIPETALTLLAAASIGAVVVLMNPGYQLVEVEYMLKKTGAKGIVMLESLKTLHHYETLKHICPELDNSTIGELNSKKLPELKHVFMVNLMPNVPFDANKYKGASSFSELERFSKPKILTPHVDMDDSVVILFTSGTTGSPKGAVLSHHNLINSSYLGAYCTGVYQENNIACCPIPLFHVFGLVAGALMTLVHGQQTVFPSFLPDTLAMIKAVHNERCTTIQGAPVIFIDMLNHPERKNYDLSSLKYMLIGASTIPKDVLFKIKKYVGIEHIIVGYGMTETSAAGLMSRKFDAERCEKHAYESIGLPIPFVECKITDSNGQIAPHNTNGEICLRGYNIMKGYWDEPVKTAETIDENGWLKTGDIGYMDEKGYVFFKSRAKEVIIRGGVNIYPAEIESFMRTNPCIMDAYCFGVEDERMGEEVCIWIKLQPDAMHVTEEDIKKFCENRIAFFKIPKYVKFVQGFPISPNGKVQKFKMSAQMKEELAKK